MHVEAEILSKIFVNGIQRCVKGILHHEQVGFIPEITRLFNIQKSVDGIYKIDRLKKENHMTLPLSLGLGKVLLKLTLKAQSTKGKTDTLDSIKIKNICFEKVSVKRINRQATN